MIDGELTQPAQPGAMDKVLDALLSDRGHSLVSVAVSMAAKNMVAAYVETTASAASRAAGAESEDVT